jgi:nicotinate-nucleotide pyrophosphorylase (carboxylating)
MIPDPLLNDALDRALCEDLSGGDPTTEACVSEDSRGRAHAVAKSSLVVAGGAVFARVFYRLDPTLRVELHLEDGAEAQPGERLWTVEGRTRSILCGERTALNFVQRMCGIATLTAAYVRAVPRGSSLRITDTRKTTPGLRIFERYAVRCGGGKNHRDQLGSAVLLKDNHIVAAGGISTAVRRARDRSSHTARIEVEVESIAQLDEALAAGADIVMLDNFAPTDIAAAVERARGRAFVEVSGGVGQARIAELARAGVDAVSVGSLTHSAAAADISLDLETFDAELPT